MQLGIRTPVRGALETVQEVSQNNSPAHETETSLAEHVKEKLAAPDSHSDGALSDGGPTFKSKAGNMAPGAGNVSASKPESRRPSSVPPPPPPPPLVSRQSSAVLTKQAKPKPEGSTQNMTVETETVPSIPQVALASGTKAEAANGTLKTKPSAETKPKKDKKKPARKQPQVNSGTGRTACSESP